MSKLGLSFLAAYLIFMQAGIAGQDVGNGGGFALCSDQKFYSYDFLITLKNSFGPPKENLNFKQRIQFVAVQLERLREPLAKDFVEFMSLLYTQIPGKRFQWYSDINLPLIYDPDPIALLPAGCRVRKQAAYHFDPINKKDYTTYTYDASLISRVQTQAGGDLQISYLWIHEWLWNYFPPENFVKMAYFNRLLNSEVLGNLSVEQYHQMRNELFAPKQNKRSLR